MKRRTLSTSIPRKKLAANPVGRPSGYKPEYAQIATHLCRLGATDADLAYAFGVTTSTIYYWSANYEEFSQSKKSAKPHADGKVQHSLYQRAVGYTYDSEDIYLSRAGRVIRVPTKKHVPPDITACIFWLKNRNKAEWRDVHKLEHTGEDGKPIEYKNAKHQLAQKIAAISGRLNGGERSHPRKTTNGSGTD